VKASVAGSVYFTGAWAITISGSGNLFEGVQFLGGSCYPLNATLQSKCAGVLLTISGNWNTVSSVNFHSVYAQKYVSITGGSQYNTIHRCNIEAKPYDASVGAIVHIWADIAGLPGYHKIQNCTFLNIWGKGGDYGNEPIRLGNGNVFDKNLRATVEFNYFRNVGYSDSETISLKSRQNIIRFNTFDKNPLGELVARNAEEAWIYGNFFLRGSGGIRIKEASKVYAWNNYFDGSGDATLPTYPVGIDYVAPFAQDIVFAFNTFVDNAMPLNLGGQTIGNATVTITFANNAFVKKASTVPVFINSNGLTTWKGNLISSDATCAVKCTPSDMRADMAKLASIKNMSFLTWSAPAGVGSSANLNVGPTTLAVPVSDDTGTLPSLYATLGVGSAAIGSAQAAWGTIPAAWDSSVDVSVSTDIHGRPRGAAKDVGAAAFSAAALAPSANRPLTHRDVGPAYTVAHSFNVVCDTCLKCFKGSC
jgi:hypothetical protein